MATRDGVRDLRTSLCHCGFLVAHHWLDVGWIIAQHVGRAHPEWLYEPEERERLRLAREVAKRAN